MAGGKVILVAVTLALLHLSSANDASASGNMTVKVVTEGKSTLGTRSILICNINDKRADEVFPGVAVSFNWTRNGQKIPGNSGTIVLDSVRLSDEGNYTCTMLFPNGTKPQQQERGQLTVLVPPLLAVTQKGDPNFVVLEGGDLTLSCHLTVPPNPPVPDHAYTWSFHPQNGGPEKILNSTMKDLHIQQVHRNQSGRYHCAGNNGVTSPVNTNQENATIEIQIQYLDDHVTLTPREWQTVKPGVRVSLTCQVGSLPRASLTWLHQGHVLHTVESNEYVYSFTVTGCDDSGEYQCRAENKFFKKSSLAATKLTVASCAPVLVEGSTSPARVTVKVGDNVTLTVTVTADPAPSFLWSGPGLSSAQSPSLALYSLQPQQAGLYTVIVSNTNGSLNHTFLLEVTGKDTKASTGPASSTASPVVGAVGGLLVLLICVMIVCFVIYKIRRRHRKHNESIENTQEMESVWSQGSLPPGLYDSSLHYPGHALYGHLPSPCGGHPGYSLEYESGAPLMPTAPFDETMLADRSSSEIEDDVSGGPYPPPSPPSGQDPIYDIPPAPRSTGR